MFKFDTTSTVSARIANSKGFSPYLCPSVYECGSKKDGGNSTDYLVIAEKSEIPVSKYKAIEADQAYTNLYENFFDSKTDSIRVINKDTQKSVYPFAEDCPEVYLNLPHNSKLAIRARSYSPVKEIIKKGGCRNPAGLQKRKPFNRRKL